MQIVELSFLICAEIFESRLPLSQFFEGVVDSALFFVPYSLRSLVI
jgi:hypothetical protein